MIMLARAGAAAMQSARRAPAPGPWDPGDIAGYAFDYDGESYASGTLFDISGNGRDLSQADVAKRPTQDSRNGRLALEFDGAQLLSGVFGATLSQPLTIYVVAEPIGSGTRTALDGGSVTNRIRFYFTTGGYSINAGTALSAGPAVTSQTGVALQFNGGASAVFAEDFTDPTISGDAGPGGMDGLTVGGSAAGTPSFTGYIWRVIGYLGAHDAPTRKLMGDYLSAQYSTPIVT